MPREDDEDLYNEEFDFVDDDEEEAERNEEEDEEEDRDIEECKSESTA